MSITMEWKRKNSLSPAERRILSYRSHIAIKATVGSILCIFITHIFHLPYLFSFFSVVTVVVLNTVFHYEVISKSFERLFGALIVSFISFCLVAVAAQSPIIYFVAVWVILLICFYLFCIKWYAYSMLFGGLIGAIVMLSSIAHPEMAFKVTLDLSIHLTLGVFITVIVELISPSHTLKTYRFVLSELLNGCAEILTYKSSSDEKQSALFFTLKQINHIQSVVKLVSTDNINLRATAIHLVVFIKLDFGHIAKP